MNKPVFHLLKIFFLLISSYIFFSCSEADVEIESVKPCVVFDFNNETDAPLQRLSVFVRLKSDFQRIEALKIFNVQENYEWYANELSVYGSSDSRSVGFSNFLPPKNTVLPKGEYTASVIDKTEKEESLPFVLSYDDLLLKKHSSDFPGASSGQNKEYIALYAENGDLLYYGSRKSDWKTDNDIWNENDDAVSFRTCYLNQDETVMCMMPAVLKNTEVKE